jgi:uncharacterized membrane protein HdeD (DUF308 family)
LTAYGRPEKLTTRVPFPLIKEFDTAMYRPAPATSIPLGILSVIIGIMALAWPGITVLAIVLLFAIYAFSRGFLQAAHAFRSRAAGSVLGHLVLAVIDIAAGLFAAAWPAPTALVIVLVLGIWAITGGVFEFFAAFRSGESLGSRALFLIGGLVAAMFGLVILARPGVGALTLALLFGLFSLIYGTWQISMGIEMHSGRTRQ